MIIGPNIEECLRKDRPIIDAQEYEIISAAIGESYTDGVPASFRLYDPYEDSEITGVVIAVDTGPGAKR